MIDIDEELEACKSKDDLKRLITLLSDERDELENKLAEAADILADAGRIHNTPYSKQQWCSGGLP